MSGAHFAVECDANRCRLRYRASRNGTKLNGELVTEGVLKNGDRVYAGRTDFIVRIEAFAKSESVPAPAPLKPSEVPTAAVAQEPSSRGKKSEKIKSPAPVSESIRPREAKTERRQMTSVERAPQIESPSPSPPIERVPTPAPPADATPAAALDT